MCESELGSAVLSDSLPEELTESESEDWGDLLFYSGLFCLSSTGELLSSCSESDPNSPRSCLWMYGMSLKAATVWSRRVPSNS